jgi:hypothetical protein
MNDARRWPREAGGSGVLTAALCAVIAAIRKADYRQIPLLGKESPLRLSFATITSRESVR